MRLLNRRIYPSRYGYQNGRRILKTYFLRVGILVSVVVALAFGASWVLPGAQATGGHVPGCGFATNHRPGDLKYEGAYYLPGELDSNLPRMEGEASFYGLGEEPNAHTGSGELFDANAMTAATWRYEIGTRLKVTDPSTGNSVIVRVNDRGPDRNPRFAGDSRIVPNRIIDLTVGAARKLNPNFVSRGVIPVIVEPVCP